MFLRRVDLPEPGELRLVARVYVWARWFVWALATFAWLYPLNVAEVVYPPNVALALLLLASNGCLHYRLATKGTLSWRWMLAPSALDLALLSAGVAAHRGFETPFFVGYYPCLAMFAVVVGSVRLALAWVTMTAVVYTALCLAVEPGLDVSGNDEEILLIRVAGMYLVVVVVNLISRVEQIRRMEAVARERALQRERIELSHTIHDTTAQSAFMIGLGIDAVQRLVGDSNAEVKTRLDATAKLSKTAIWQLRHPIDVGRIFDGRGLGRTLESHVSTFTQITSVQADLAQHGVEPPSRWRPGTGCSPWPTTPSPTRFAMRRRAGCWWNSTSARIVSGCRSRTTAWVSPSTTPTAATDSPTCGRTPSGWADVSSWNREGRPAGRA